MAMTVGSSGGSGEPQVLASINTTPLVDVMLVLLIIFLITIPVITNYKKVELPKVNNIPTQTKPVDVTVSVDVNGDVYWNGKPVPDRQDLLDRIQSTAMLVPQPEIHIRADLDTRYEAVGRVIYLIQRGGVSKVAFLTEPQTGIRGSR